MNPKLEALLPKKSTPYKQLCEYKMVNHERNEAISDCLAALSKADVAVVPSEEDVAILISDFIHSTVPEHDIDRLAKAIRAMMLGEEKQHV